MEGILLILLFVAVIGITAILFGGWLLVTIIRAIVGGLSGLFETRPPRALTVSSGWNCQRAGCRSSNPSHAQFCRRCGRPAAAQQRVSVQRIAAML